MSDLVVDANVAVKWVIEEEHSDRSQKLFEDTVRARDRLIGPPRPIREVVSVIYQRLRSKDPERHISEQEAEAALERFLALPVLVVAPEGLYAKSFSLARAHGLTNTYDSQYVALAEILGVELWTDDRALLKALDARAQWVRSIGDYPLDSP